MADVLFDVGKSNLRPEGREDLAKFSGIVINYPKLRLTTEGHTDSSGNHESNQRLSSQRATAVLDYLVKHGLDPGLVWAHSGGRLGRDSRPKRPGNLRARCGLALKPGLRYPCDFV